MKKINIAELLKDCPKGMELYSPIFGELKFNEVNTINNRILVVQQNDYIAEFESDGRLINCKNGECLLFPSKGKTTWDGFVPPCEFKDGDVLVHTQNGRFIMSIYKSTENEKLINTHVIFWDREEGLSVGMQICCYTDSVRFATEEEKAKLFKAIKDNGYKWNADTKTLEKLPEPKFKVGDKVLWNYNTEITRTITAVEYDAKRGYVYWIVCKGCSSGWWGENELTPIPNKFDIATLKPFDKVLVRDNNEQFWTCDWFSFHDTKQVYPFACVGHYVSQCIPYEKNEHLLGKTDDCNEYFKTWEE